MVGSGWVQIFPLVVGCVGLSQLADGLGWIGSHKMDPWTTLGPTYLLLTADSRSITKYDFITRMLDMYCLLFAVILSRLASYN